MRINKNNSVPVSTQELGPLIRSFISEKKQVIITATGNSMKPFLRDGRDKVVLSAPTRKPQKSDVLFYLRDDGTYVLHRVFKVNKDEYIMLGDAQVIKEYGITDRHIIAIASAFIKNGRELDCKVFGYRICVWIWRSLYPLRLFKAKALYIVKRTFSK